MELSVTIGGVMFEHPVMNAAGTVKTLSDVARMAAQASVSAIMVGSATVLPRPGNPGKVYHYDQETRTSLNSLGLPNGGIPYYQQELPKMRQVAREHGKKLALSIAGFSPDDYEQLALMAVDAEVDVIEVNLGCPNAWSEDGERKPIACFRPGLVDNILLKVFTRVRDRVPVWVKPSPFSDPLARIAFAEVVSKYPIVAVTNINTWPDGSAFDGNSNTVIEANNGFAGVGGSGLKFPAIGQTRHFRQLLPETIKLVGVGGVRSGRDAMDLMRAGASMVQIATAFLRDGANLNYAVFQQVVTDLVDLLEPATS